MIISSSFKRVTVGAALGGALLLSAGVGLANADTRDGQVDVVVGTAGVLENVPLGAASQVAAGVCDRDVNQITSVAENVDVSSAQQNVCNNTLGAVDFRQNVGATTPQGVVEQPESATPQGNLAEGTDAEGAAGAAEGTAGASEAAGTEEGSSAVEAGAAPSTSAVPAPAHAPAA